MPPEACPCRVLLVRVPFWKPPHVGDERPRPPFSCAFRLQMKTIVISACLLAAVSAVPMHLCTPLAPLSNFGVRLLFARLCACMQPVPSSTESPRSTTLRPTSTLASNVRPPSRHHSGTPEPHCIHQRKRAGLQLTSALTNDVSINCGTFLAEINDGIAYEYAPPLRTRTQRMRAPDPAA